MSRCVSRYPARIIQGEAKENLTYADELCQYQLHAACHLCYPAGGVREVSALTVLGDLQKEDLQEERPVSGSQLRPSASPELVTTPSSFVVPPVFLTKSGPSPFGWIAIGRQTSGALLRTPTDLPSRRRWWLGC